METYNLVRAVLYAQFSFSTYLYRSYTFLLTSINGYGLRWLKSER